MQLVNKSHLLNALLALVQRAAQHPERAPAQELAQQIEQAIDEAMATSASLESRRVTILLSDLRGFTSISEKYSALAMVEALNRYFERMSEIILRHGGVIDKFMGDAIMVLFGAPVSHSTDIEDALSCAIEMQIAMASINADNEQLGMAPLFMGIGINTGEVVAGNLGSALHSEYTVIGDQVNLASRVEAHSLRGQILLSENTYQLARAFIEIGDINEVHVKGKKDVVRMYELLAITTPTVLTAPKREIRKSPRVEVDMPLRFYLIVGKSVQAEARQARIIDMSYGGMFIVCAEALEAFSDIKITLSLSLMVQEQSEIYAKVLRVSQFKDQYECRIEFTAIEAQAQKAIKDFVDGIVEMQ